MTKLQTLAEAEGFQNEFLMGGAFIHESIVPAICTNKDCDCIYQYEPDCINGWCEVCGTSSVSSFMVLMGVI